MILGLGSDLSDIRRDDSKILSYKQYGTVSDGRLRKTIRRIAESLRVRCSKR